MKKQELNHILWITELIKEIQNMKLKEKLLSWLYINKDSDTEQINILDNTIDTFLEEQNHIPNIL